MYEKMWEKRGLDYVPGPFLDGEADSIVSWVRTMSPAETLDVGAGWGRMYALLGQPANFTMCDFVDSRPWRHKAWRKKHFLVRTNV